MPWTTPPTFAAGATLTAAQLNILGGDLAVVGGSWTDYVPTPTNLTIGNGTITGRYNQTGKTVDFITTITFGSTTVLTGSPTLTLPVTGLASFSPLGAIGFDASGTVDYPIFARISGGTTVIFRTWPTTAGNSLPGLSSTVPVTWATGDVIVAGGRYEVP